MVLDDDRDLATPVSVARAEPVGGLRRLEVVHLTYGPGARLTDEPTPHDKPPHSVSSMALLRSSTLRSSAVSRRVE